MFRKTLTILSLIGLLLSAGLWGVSYWDLGVSCRRVTATGRDDTILLSGGKLRWMILHPSQSYTGSAEDWKVHRIPIHPYAQDFYDAWMWRPIWNTSSSKRNSRISDLTLPLYITTLLTAFLSWLAHTPRHRRIRKNLGLCLNCGYDLRGSKDRCPECNTPFDPAKLGQADLRSWRARFLGAMTHYSSLVFPLLMIFCVLMAFVIGSCLL